MTTTVTYHREYGRAARPAVNVKLHAAGLDFWPSGAIFPEAGTPGEHDRDYDALVGAAYDRVQSDFWQAASEQAAILGLGEIAQEGRSGGWLVLADGRDPQEPDTFYEDRDISIADWLAAYARLAAWCEAELRAAPARVRGIAQGMAMDAAGEMPFAVRGWERWFAPVPSIGKDAARRLFAFLAPYPGESYGEVAARTDAWCIASPDGMGPHRPDDGTCAECGRTM